MKLSYRIKELCKEKGVRQKDLAVVLGISETSFSTAVNEERFNITALKKIAAALGVDVSELFAPKRSTLTCPNCGAEIEVRVYSDRSASTSPSKESTDTLKSE